MYLELDLAGREGFVLHGDGAVGSQHGDAQLLLPVHRLLVPLLHLRRLIGWDHCHLEGHTRTRKTKYIQKSRDSDAIGSLSVPVFHQARTSCCPAAR